jgi:bla regulator protein blaR1
MNAPNELMLTLAWSLLHFLWQGAAIAALAAALLYVFRKPATRYLIGVGALGLMLLSFGVTFSLLSSSHEPSAAATAVGAPAAALVPPAGIHVPSKLPWTEGQAATDSAVDFTWLARGWLVGVFILALRIAFGLFVIEQLRRRNLVALPDALVKRLQALQSRLGIARGIHYAQCQLVNVPAVIGFFRPVVLLPMRALTGLSPEQLEALVAHELGHIKRFDVAVNFVQVIAETLFFFHPAVWWLNKRIRDDREDCCDDIAVSAGGSSVGYAKALATIAHWRDVPSFAMAATRGPVAARVARLLGMSRDGSRTAGVFTATLVLAGALLAGAVSLGFTEPAQAQSAETAPSAALPEAPPPPAPPAARPAKPAQAAKPAKPAKPAQPARDAAAPVTSATPVVDVETRVNATPRVDVESRVDVETQVDVQPKFDFDHSFTRQDHSSYMDEMRAADLGDLDVDQLIALRVQGVHPDYIKSLRDTGLDPSVDQIIALKVQGVTPDYVKQVRAMGFDVDTDEIIAFKVHGVSPEFVQSMRTAGFKVDADEIIALRAQDVTPAYVKQMRDLGLTFDTDELVALRTHDITPDYIRQMRANGFNADTEQLISLRVHDITPEYRKSMESAGLKLDTDQLIEARVMDITPAFVNKAAAHGFKNLDIDRLIALKNADVL